MVINLTKFETGDIYLQLGQINLRELYRDFVEFEKRDNYGSNQLFDRIGAESTEMWFWPQICRGILTIPAAGKDIANQLRNGNIINNGLNNDFILNLISAMDICEEIVDVEVKLKRTDDTVANIVSIAIDVEPEDFM